MNYLLRNLICLSFVVIAGCGGDRPPLASLTGTVTLDGEPIQYGGLMFTPTGGGRPSVAGTNKKGEFTAIYVYGVPGAIIGKHTVTFEEGSAENIEQDEFKPYAPPAKNFTISPTEIEVESGGTVINFTLQRKTKKKDTSR